MPIGDPSIFYYCKNVKLSGIAAIHVKLFMGWWPKILYLLFVIFVTGKTLKNAFRYLGLELNWNIQNITLDQIHYISLLQSLTQKLINTRNAISDVVQ